MNMDRAIIELDTTGDTDVLDLSREVQSFLSRSQIQEGWLLLFVPGSTAGLTTIEFESGAVKDLKRAIERLAPRDGDYEHNLRWGDGNGYSHVRAALMGPSLTVPVTGGQLATGTWQQIVLCDFDNRPRRRRVHVQALAT